MSEPTFSSVEPTESTRPLSGVEHAGVIDTLRHDAETDEVSMVMIEHRPWDGSELRLFQLQEKINAYLSFALDGEMADVYPALTGKKLRLVLKCATVPDAMVRQFLALVRDQISFQGIEFEVRAASNVEAPLVASSPGSQGGGCGSGSCGCGN